PAAFPKGLRPPFSEKLQTHSRRDTVAKEIWIVHCAAEAFRRAGIAFAKGANELDASVLTNAQLAAIEAEPNLAVEKPGKGSGDDSGGDNPGKTEHPPTEAKGEPAKDAGGSQSGKPGKPKHAPTK